MEGQRGSSTVSSQVRSGLAPGTGFEPSVPRKRENGFRDCRWLAFHARGLTMSAISDVIEANILVASFL